MRDVHIHFLHGRDSGYTQEFLQGFITAAQRVGLDEIYLLKAICVSLKQLKVINIQSR